MSTELETALRACAQMSPVSFQKAGKLVSDIRAIKQQIESRAAALGYSERCRQAILVCRGECCIWHFPKTLTAVDFLMAVFDLAADEKKALVEQVRYPEEPPYQCPLLKKDGCIFEFQSRPIVCTSAFPCLAGTKYWQFKETFRKDIETLYAALGSFVDGF